jgi:uncharacterized protein HemY
MATYFVEYLLSTDHRNRAFFGKVPDDKSEDKAKKMITEALKKAYGESVLIVAIARQNTGKKIISQQKKLDEEATQ